MVPTLHIKCTITVGVNGVEFSKFQLMQWLPGNIHEYLWFIRSLYCYLIYNFVKDTQMVCEWETYFTPFRLADLRFCIIWATMTPFWSVSNGFITKKGLQSTQEGILMIKSKMATVILAASGHKKISMEIWNNLLQLHVHTLA